MLRLTSWLKPSSGAAARLPSLAGLLGQLGGLGGLSGLGESTGSALTGGIGIGIRLGPQTAPPSLEDTILEAAPKKKTSHRKKRQRQLSGNKQIKPLRNINRCPSCGHYKRAHTLCMHCVKEIQTMWKSQDRPSSSPATYSEKNMDPEDLRILYPGKARQDYEQKLRRKDQYLYKRPRTLPAKDGQSK